VAASFIVNRRPLTGAMPTPTFSDRCLLIFPQLLGEIRGTFAARNRAKREQSTSYVLISWGFYDWRSSD
jgi:hypothetical protein